METTPALEQLGSFVRDRRSTLKLTQAQLAQRLGWTQERISVLENGKYGMPSVPALIRLAAALDAPFADLLVAVGYPDVIQSRPPAGDETSSVALGYALQRLLTLDVGSLEEALGEASDFLAQAMGADKIDAFLYESDNESLVAVGTSATPMGRRQHELGLDREPLANGGRTVEVYQTGQSYYTPHADQDPGMVRGVVKGLGVRSYLAVPLTPDGETIGVLTAASALHDHFGEDERRFFEAVARWVAMIARRAELREEITRLAAADARRLAAEELVTLLAHDLRNAITPITGRLDLLRRRLQREEWTRVLEDVDEVSRSMQRLQRLISELLDVARIDQGIFALSPQTVDLVALVEEVVDELCPLRETITVRLPEELRVQVDPGRIRQVLHNLVSNAITHTPDDVPILVGAGTEVRDDARWAVVSVHDEGPGISSRLMDGLFTRFTSDPASPGLGIGLYLAREIVESHGGTLTVESVQGKGTTFCVSLPLDTRTGQGAGNLDGRHVSDRASTAGTGETAR